MAEPIITFVGPPSSGKSSLIGALLVKCNAISKYALEDACADAEALGNKDRAYALLVDEELRERMDGHTHTLKFLGKLHIKDDKVVRIIDTPGLFRFLRDMHSGVCISDALIVVIRKYNGNIQPYLRFFFDLAKLYDEEILIIINTSIKESFNRIRNTELKIDYEKFLGVYEVSVSKQESIEELLDVLSEIRGKKRDLEKPFRLPILKIGGEGNIFIGVITHGSIKVYDWIALSPTYKVGRIASIEKEGGSLDRAVAGDDVGVILSGIGRQYVKVGHLIGSLREPPHIALKIKMRVVNKIHDLHEKSVFTAILHSFRTQCRIEEVRQNEAVLIFHEKVPIESYEEYPELSGIVLLKGSEIVAYGACECIIE